MKKIIIASSLWALLWGCDTENNFHRLEVVNGTVLEGENPGEYKVGQNLTVEANDPPPNQAFFRWTGDTAFLEELRAPRTTLTMPFHDLRIEDTYADLPRYRLTVIAGEGSGEYLAGTIVTISARVPDSELEFNRWIGDTVYILSTTEAVTNAEIPEKAIELEATFRERTVDIPEVSFANEVLPIFITRCASAGCHDNMAISRVRLTNYEQITASIEESMDLIEIGDMPSEGDPLTDQQIQTIQTWIDQGMKNN